MFLVQSLEGEIHEQTVPLSKTLNPHVAPEGLFWIKEVYLQSFAVGYGAVPWVTGNKMTLFLL